MTITTYVENHQTNEQTKLRKYISEAKQSQDRVLTVTVKTPKANPFPAYARNTTKLSYLRDFSSHFSELSPSLPYPDGEYTCIDHYFQLI